MSSYNIDNIVNYRREYAAAVSKNNISGNRLTGLCPFHNDKNASLSVDLTTGKYTCFACGEAGNYIDFYAKTRGIDTKEAYKLILKEYGIAQDESKPESIIVPYDASIYAEEKHLPEEWLIRSFTLSSSKERSGQKYIKIPYLDEQCNQVVFRKRYPKESSVRFKWAQGSAGKLIPYGLWFLDKIREAGYVILVEGESDTQTLWYMDLPALGVPGASTFKPVWCEKLSGLNVYIHIEPDRGGQTFLSQMKRKLSEGGFEGEVFTFSCQGAGFKDPSDLFIDKGVDYAKEYIEKSLKEAKKLNISDIEVAIKDAPVNLRQPEGWIYSDKGISQIDPKTFDPKCICRTPIILTRRFRSGETGEEKIEVAFKRDDRWKAMSFPRSLIFQSKSIVALADQGCTITSENAKYVVKFLQALEEENIDIIEVVESTSTFGWQTRNRFLPGHGGDLVLDIDPSTQGWANAYCLNGSLDGWVKQMKGLRQNDRFRFILAGSFAAPLLKILKQRIFFVYNWGGSKGGKTAAIKAALSAWGDPEGLMANFNSTTVGLERAAAFFSDLPLGIDERQLAGQKQESLEKLVYMLASGQGKLRGAKNGGIQAMNTWKSVILASGEEPIVKETTQTGVSTRMIEVIGAPFDGEEPAREMHNRAAENCGWAGPKFVEYINSLGEPYIADMYASILSTLQDMTKSTNGAHTAAIATVALADILIGQALFEPGTELNKLIDQAFEMAVHIDADIRQNEPPDVNISALRFIMDWVQMNEQNFAQNARDPRLGHFDAYGNILIYPTALRNALEREGFSNRKVIKFMADEGLIATQSSGGKTVSTVVKRIDGHTGRFICLYRDKIARFEGLDFGFEDVADDEQEAF